LQNTGNNWKFLLQDFVRNFRPSLFLMLNKIAYIISVITHPVFLFSYAFMYLLFNTDIFLGITQMYKIWMIISYLVLNSILIPLMLIFFFERNFNITERKKRFLPYAIMAVVYIIIYIFFLKFHFPDIIRKFLLGITIGLCALIIINFFLKISMHTTSAGATIALFMYLYFIYPEDFFSALMIIIVLAGLIGSSRLKLNEHTRLELYSGYLLGFVITFLVMIL
jgi:hypothetical protein